MNPEAPQAILFGGITTPGVIHYERGLKVPPTGPILDTAGHPFARAEAGSSPED